MPTDLLRAFASRRAGERRNFWRQTLLIAGISLTGAIFTIARALQSETFGSALTAFAGVE